jgi:hypothetical protein
MTSCEIFRAIVIITHPKKFQFRWQAVPISAAKQSRACQQAGANALAPAC